MAKSDLPKPSLPEKSPLAAAAPKHPVPPVAIPKADLPKPSLPKKSPLPAAAPKHPEPPAAMAKSDLPKPSLPEKSPPTVASKQPPTLNIPVPKVPKPQVKASTKWSQPSPVQLIKQPDVRVRMCQTTRQAHIEGTKVCVDGMECKDHFNLDIKDGKLRINGTQAVNQTMIFKSDQPLTIRCGKKKKRVRGVLKARTRKGKLLVINIVDIEDYLLSVVPSENPAGWPVESLKAQAVAARTYAYYQLQHRKTWAYDLVDFAGDQAYEGMDKEHRRSTDAVKATAGEILTHKGKPILAMYSANSGGHTADSQAIFNLHKPYLTAQQDPASLQGRMANWTRKFKVSEIVSRLGKIRIDAKGLKGIKAQERGPSGRIVKIRLVFKDDKTKILRNRTTLRRALDLPEILHKIHLEGDTFTFEGHGWGHGVGYSQWGSAYMGKKKKYKEILSFYYGDARMEKMW
jgi:stage II sporulation protein D